MIFGFMIEKCSFYSAFSIINNGAVDFFIMVLLMQRSNGVGLTSNQK